MKKNLLKLSVIVPCYNEEKRFKEGSAHFLSYLNKQKYKWELIFVNDGSKDKTISLIKQLKKRNNNIKIVTYAKNHGKGYAIVQGVNKAKGQIIIFSDLDHSVSIDTIESFFKYFQKGFQIVIGSRRVKGAKFLKRQPPIRELLGRGFTLLVRVLIDFKIKDATCGFKAFKLNIAKNSFNKIKIYDWAFDAEILFLCKKYNYKLAQAPVAWRDAKGTKVSIGKDILRSLGGLIKIRINDLQKKYA